MIWKLGYAVGRPQDLLKVRISRETCKTSVCMRELGSKPAVIFSLHFPSYCVVRHKDFGKTISQKKERKVKSSARPQRKSAHATTVGLREVLICCRADTPVAIDQENEQNNSPTDVQKVHKYFRQFLHLSLVI